MTPVYALTICLLLYAFGNIISVKSKGVLSVVFILAVSMLMGFWLGMPADIAETAGVTAFGKVGLNLLVVGVGTTMNFKELARQWRTVIVSFVCCAAGVILIILIGQFIVGYDAAVAGAPIFAGAAVALMVVNEALESLGLTETLGVIIIMVYALQKFIGVPLSSFCLNKEANLFIKDREKVQHYFEVSQAAAADEKPRPLAFLNRTEKPVYIITKMALIASISTAASALTHDKVNAYIFCLLFGVVFTELGFLPNNALNKIDSYFLILFSIFMTVFSTLATVTPQTLLASIIPVFSILLIGTAGVCIFGVIMAKVFKQSAWLNIALGITCTFGFPTTVMVSEEIAEGVGTTPEEKEALRNYLIPQMTVAGFVTVTIGSVVLASLIVPLLG